MATTSLEGSTLRQITARLKAAQDVVVRHYPGEPGQRQPVHTVYGGAHLFKSDTVRKLGDLALEALGQYAPSATVFADAIGVDPGIAQTVGTLSPFIGIRIKTLSGEVAARALRTLDIYLTALLRETSGKLPANFVVTLPKITSPAQVSALIDAFEALEPAFGLPAGALKMEPMIEMTQSILDQDGASMLPKLLRAGRGRIVAAHFGTYDYTASCNITAAYQHMRHPACDFAKQMMQVAYAGTGIWLSDGATGILPVPLHRGDALTVEQKRDNQRAVHAAWRLHADDTRHSLANGYYQGWDLHPAQLPSRYGAAYGFFIKGLPAASERLKNFVGKAAQATLVGDVFDDAATGQGLLNFFLRGVNCGALLEEEALATGLTLEELRGRSFLKILNGRRAAAQKA
jgi:hypothetical protein